MGGVIWDSELFLKYAAEISRKEPPFCVNPLGWSRGVCEPNGSPPRESRWFATGQSQQLQLVRLGPRIVDLVDGEARIPIEHQPIFPNQCSPPNVHQAMPWNATTVYQSNPSSRPEDQAVDGKCAAIAAKRVAEFKVERCHVGWPTITKYHQAS